MLKKLAFVSFCVFSILTCCSILVNYKDYKKNQLKEYVKQRVVYITNDDGTSGGTGVQVKAPSGNEYILTNSHVCTGVGKDGMLKVSLDDKTHLYRHIIENSRDFDLCLVEPLPQVEGLSLASDQEYGKIVYVVGHPLLMPSNMVEGELLERDRVDVFDHYIDPEHPCDQPKQKIVPPGDICVESLEAIITNITIFPGNSGSPVVDWDGKLVALAFAGSSESHYGLMVPLDQIRTFLKNY